VRRLTDGELLVERVLSVDETAGWVYFLGQGGDAHPYDQHLYRVSLEGQGLTRLTEAPGVHEVSVSPSHQVFVDNHSAPDRPPRSELRRIDGSLVAELERADVSALDALGWQPPEEVTAKAADGKTDLYGMLYKPVGFDPARRYPLVEVIYGGPQGSVTPRRFVPGDTCHFAQALAQLGFVTAILDARGTPGRGKAFQDVVYRSIGRHEIPDHVAMLRQLAATRPYVDLERVGIWGKSWGGYFALRGMLLAPDFYRVGVSWAPVAELVSVGVADVEPYMERPLDNPEGYAYASNLDVASALRGKLLIIIGTADQNTPFAHTMRMVEALIRADKPVDLLVLPEQHHWPEGTSRRYVFETVRRYFVDHLGTDREAPLRAAGSGERAAESKRQ
jgi:dipeptidyl aminopeptidase/acylaminoacyl peptidase